MSIDHLGRRARRSLAARADTVRNTGRSHATLIAAASLLAVATSWADAAPYNWDPGQTTTATGGGAGTWDTVMPNWFNGTADVVWPNTNPNADEAILGGTAGGAVSIANDGSTSIFANKLTFNTTGYNVTGGTVTGGASLTLNGTAPTITTNQSATISARLGGAGFAKAGGFTLILTGDNTIGSGTLTYGSNVAPFNLASTNFGAIRLGSNTALGGYTTVNLPTNNTAQSRIELINNITVGFNITTSGRSNQQSTGAALVNISGNNVFNGNVTIAGTGGAYGIRTDAGLLTINGNLLSTVASVRGFDIGGSGNATVAGVISDQSSANYVNLTKFGTGTLLLTAANTNTGITTVSGGTLRVSGTGRIGGPAGTRDVVVADAGLLDLLVPAIADGSSLKITSTDAADEIVVGTGVNDLIGSLTLNGNVLPAGTYGSVASLAADNANIVALALNPDDFFGGTGTVTSAVPEPASLGLLALAGAGLLTRRRRLTR